MFSLTARNFVLSDGYAMASVNYRLSNEAHFPAQIQDVKTAVRWLAPMPPSTGTTPTRSPHSGIRPGGSSSPCWAPLAAWLPSEGANLGNARVSSASAAVVLYPDIDLLSERKWLSTNPACVGKFSSPDLPGSAASKYLGAPIQTVPAEANAADPITYITPGKHLPKFLIAAGTADCTVPYQGSVDFYQALVKVGGPSAARADPRPGLRPLPGLRLRADHRAHGEPPRWDDRDADTMSSRAAGSRARKRRDRRALRLLLIAALSMVLVACSGGSSPTAKKVEYVNTVVTTPAGSLTITIGAG